MKNVTQHMMDLENESIEIFREVAAKASNPVMLYSIGKDSSVMLRLAQKAFYPGKIPFPLMHVDTGWKFREMIEFRDKMARQIGFKLIVYRNIEGEKNNINPIDHGSAYYTDVMKTEALKQALDLHKFDFILGGARRDEEKSRAKERVFSFRAPGHRWDPKQQRPELWNIYNTKLKPEETLRVFPLSNWTEIDIWNYIRAEEIPITPLYFAKERPVISRNDQLIMLDDERFIPQENEKIEYKMVRFRTLGCYPLTCAMLSEATTLDDVINEISSACTSERQGRIIDHDGAGSMERKKQEGYF